MKTPKTRNAILALIGLAALSVYILACTSFSPDDSKVLYPAFDTDSGAVGMAVYDREARRTDMVLIPAMYDIGESNTVLQPRLLRAQWLGDGHSILTAYAGGKGNNDEISLAVSPWGATAPTKLFQVPEIKDEGNTLLLPLCVCNGQLLLRVSEKEIARIDLKSLALVRHEFADVCKEIVLYPSPNGDGVFYVEPQEGEGKAAVFGRLNPENFSRTPLLNISNESRGDSVFAYDNQGKVVALLEAGDTNRLLVLQQGKPAWTRTLDAEGAKWTFGSAGLSPKGDMLWATYQKKIGTNAVSFGLIEVPLGAKPVRETTLITLTQPVDSEMVFYFQASVSHDGRTAAVASTYLACREEELNPADCALFLVDLSSPDRKVTKVPIPMPEKHPGRPGM
jgi:hypothetical protein